MRDASVIHQDVNLAEMLAGFLKRRLDGILDGNVELNRKRSRGGGLGAGLVLLGDLLGHPVQIFKVAAGERNACAGFRQQHGAGAPDTLGCAGDERDFSFEWHGKSRLPVKKANPDGVPQEAVPQDMTIRSLHYPARSRSLIRGWRNQRSLGFLQALQIFDIRYPRVAIHLADQSTQRAGPTSTNV